LVLQKFGQVARETFNVFVTQGIEAAKAQEDAINQLNIALASSGQLLPGVSEDFQRFASELQQTTTFGDEVILQNAALIQSLGQLDQKGLKGATQAALDLSAALGIDLTAASTLVGKAAAGEVGTFSRYGLIIEKGATQAQTFSNALAKINAQFGGAAAGQVKTFSGATQQLSNTFGDLQEEVGFTITRSEGFVQVLNLVNKVVKDLGTVVGENREGIRGFLINFLADITGAVASAIRIIGRIRLVFDQIGLAFPALSIGLQSFISFAAEQIAKFLESINFKGVFDDFIAGSKKAAEEFEFNVKFEEEALRSQIQVIEDRQRAFEDSAEVIETFEGRVREAAKNTADTQVEQANRVAEARAQLALEREFKKTADDAVEIEQAQKDIDTIIKNEETKNSILRDASQSRLEIQRDTLEKIIALEKQKGQENSKIQLAAQAKLAQVNNQILAQRLGQANQFFGDLSSLTQSKNRQLFEIGKAAALAQAVVQGALAVQNALAVQPYPVGVALASAAAIKAAVQIATISAQSLQTGITEVPRGFPNDSFPALLTSGERVVSAPQNQDLSRFLAEQGDTRLTDEKLDNIAAALGQLSEAIQTQDQSINIDIGGREVTRTLRSELRAGRTLAV
jgi:hypothetical protein